MKNTWENRCAITHKYTWDISQLCVSSLCKPSHMLSHRHWCTNSSVSSQDSSGRSILLKSPGAIYFGQLQSFFPIDIGCLLHPIPASLSCFKGIFSLAKIIKSVCSAWSLDNHCLASNQVYKKCSSDRWYLILSNIRDASKFLQILQICLQLLRVLNSFFRCWCGTLERGFPHGAFPPPLFPDMQSKMISC